MIKFLSLLGIIFLLATITIIPDADAIKSTLGSAKLVCGDQLCSEAQSSQEHTGPLVGDDIDEHGCIPSAGYSWSEEKQQCVRAWEEDTKIETIPESEKIISDTIELLFIQHAQSGTITTEDGTTKLTLNGISPITMEFSDRPNRMVDHMSTTVYVQEWSLGADSFKMDPPNAALVVHESEGTDDIIIIELLNPIYDKDAKTLQYDILSLSASDGLLEFTSKVSDGVVVDNIPEEFSQATLFIDSSNTGHIKIKATVDTTNGKNPHDATTYVFGNWWYNGNIFDGNGGWNDQRDAVTIDGYLVGDTGGKRTFTLKCSMGYSYNVLATIGTITDHAKAEKAVQDGTDVYCGKTIDIDFGKDWVQIWK